MQLVLPHCFNTIALFHCPLFEMNILTLSQERRKEDRALSLKIISSFAIPEMAPYLCRFRAYPWLAVMKRGLEKFENHVLQPI